MIATDSPVEVPETHPVLQQAARSFAIEGTLVGLSSLSIGHIHDSYVGVWQTPGGIRRYFHQRLNGTVFPDLPGLMHNVAAVTTHLAEREQDGDPMESLRLVGDVSGRSWVCDQEGQTWRTFEFVENTVSYYSCQNVEQAYQAGSMFGRFAERLSDLPPSDLVETIPDFMNTPIRLRQLAEAERADPMGRRGQVLEELEFIRQRRRDSGVLVTGLSSGVLTERVIHYDPKFDNLLFDRQSGQARCIVDLDTCMPGTLLYDLGDLLRSAAVPVPEDEPDLSLVELDGRRFEAIISGYLDSASALLSSPEIELISISPRIIGLTLAARFLTDYLYGDRYFKVVDPEHNLRRCRAQLKIVRSTERQARSLQRIVRRLAPGLS